MSSRKHIEFRTYGPDLDINPTEYAIINELALRVNEKTGLCYPSIPTLARFVHATPRTVTASIKYLKQMGIITVTHFKGKRIHNSYTLHIKECIHVPHPDRPKPSPDENNSGEKSSPETSSAEDLGKSAPVKKIPCNNRLPHRDNCRDDNSTHIPKPDQPHQSSTNPIQPHSPHAHAKDGIGLGGGGGVCRGASPRSKRTAGDMPILSSLDTNGMPKGYPDEEKYLAFIESLLTDEGQNWRRSVLMEGRKSFQRICDRGWQDKDGGFIGNWRRYARGCIAKEFEEVAHRILNWDDALISVADVEPPVVGLKPCIRPSEPTEQPQKPLPPPTKERKPDPKPEPPSMEIPAVESPLPSKPHVSPFDADPVLARQLKVHEIRRAREEAERRRLMGLPA